MTKSKSTTAAQPEPRQRLIDETALLDKLSVAINFLRQQLRGNETLVLPGLIMQMLPVNPGAGDRAKILDWRAYVVWAEWTGVNWDIIVYQDGTLKD